MASRALSNVALLLVALGLFAQLGWTVYKDILTETAAASASARIEAERNLQERLKIWNTAASADLQFHLENWLEKQTGNQNISIDHIYTRDFQNADVNWSGGRTASTTGILTVQGGRSTNPNFYVAWSRPAYLNDSGVWVADTPTFTQIPDPPEAKSARWRVKVLLQPKVMR